ncbi:hypothetical protein BDV96DRAFT_600329 [Lophiotrema nucula]|uniref:Uncharacterized protein n=1 Tax=Lophiotrema nucula TaxID=690887 RepID=A0A6A5Z5F3_9PLEO|nr:hypothetical protein BDV96DRAFT_600329 [Lophiotrema nucula]
MTITIFTDDAGNPVFDRSIQTISEAQRFESLSTILDNSALKPRQQVCIACFPLSQSRITDFATWCWRTDNSCLFATTITEPGTYWAHQKTMFLTTIEPLFVTTFVPRDVGTSTSAAFIIAGPTPTQNVLSRTHSVPSTSSIPSNPVFASTLAGLQSTNPNDPITALSHAGVTTAPSFGPSPTPLPLFIPSISMIPVRTPWSQGRVPTAVHLPDGTIILAGSTAVYHGYTISVSATGETISIDGKAIPLLFPDNSEGASTVDFLTLPNGELIYITKAIAPTFDANTASLVVAVVLGQVFTLSAQSGFTTVGAPVTTMKVGEFESSMGWESTQTNIPVYSELSKVLTPGMTPIGTTAASLSMSTGVLCTASSGSGGRNAANLARYVIFWW